MRATIALALAVGGVVMVGQALGAGIAQYDPVLALRFAPENARARALLAERKLGDASAVTARGAATADAGRVLARDPTSVSAMVTLAIAREVAKPGSGARLMALASRASRRDLRAQIWLIEEAVARGQIDGALDHYDLALRGSRAAPSLLFPTLNAALDDATIREALERRLAGSPPWATPFLAQAGSTAPDIPAALTLYEGLAARGAQLPAIGWTSIVNRAALAGEAPRAARLRDRLRGAPVSFVRDPGFTAHYDVVSIFDWATFEDGSVGASTGDGLSYDAPPGASGVAARQLLVLPQGRYRLGSQLAPGAISPAAAKWRVTCAGSSEILGTAPVDRLAEGTQFTVPADCAAQWLSLEIGLTDQSDGVSGTVDRVTVLRQGR